jgi:hypothetical protein
VYRVFAPYSPPTPFLHSLPLLLVIPQTWPVLPPCSAIL